MRLTEVKSLIKNIIVESESENIGELLGSESELDKKKAELLAKAKGIFDTRYDDNHEIGCIRASGRKSEKSLLWFVYRKNCTEPMTFSDGSTNPSTFHIIKDFSAEGFFGRKIVKDVEPDAPESPDREYIYTKDENGNVVSKKEVYISARNRNPMIRITSPEREYALHEHLKEKEIKGGNFILAMPYLTKKELEISSSFNEKDIAVAREEAMSIAAGEDEEHQAKEKEHRDKVLELKSKLEEIQLEKNNLTTQYREIKSNLDNVNRVMKGISSLKARDEYYNQTVLPLEEKLAELLKPNSTTKLDPFQNLERHYSIIEKQLEDIQGKAPKRKSLSITKLNYNSYSVIPKDIDYSRYGIVKYLCMSIGFDADKMARTYERLASLNLKKAERYYTENEVRLMLKERGLRTSDITTMTMAQILDLGERESIDKCMEAYYKLLELGAESYITKFTLRLAVDKITGIPQLGQKLLNFMTYDINAYTKACIDGRINKRETSFEDISRSSKEFISLMAAVGANEFFIKAKQNGNVRAMSLYLSKIKEYSNFEMLALSEDLQSTANDLINGELKTDPTPADLFTKGSRDYVFAIAGAKTIYRLIGVAYKRIKDAREEREVEEFNSQMRAKGAPVGRDAQTPKAKKLRAMTDKYLGTSGVQTRDQAQNVAASMIDFMKK